MRASNCKGGIGQPAVVKTDGSYNISGCTSADNNAWDITSSGALDNRNKTNTNNASRVRPFAPLSPTATPPAVYDIPFSSIVEAWLECERNKRTAASCIKFRWHAARDLVELWQQIRRGEYRPRKSMAFMVEHPVLREVWAAAFRDRVVHHWEALRFYPLIEKYIIDSGNRSMNCRKGYGTLRAVETFVEDLRRYTDGYRRSDCYIVGGDFANYFMSIDKQRLWRALEQLVGQAYEGEDKTALLYLMHTTLMHRCQDDYFLRSPLSAWEGLPRRKSLFYSDGLPIGNLTSQLWANFFGAAFMRYMVKERGAQGFVLFVDDWRALVPTAEQGRRMLADARRWLADNLGITLHPDKVYLQHYSKGTKMIGAVVKPWRTYAANRACGRFREAVRRLNAEAEGKREACRVAMLPRLCAVVNSYLGLLSHHRSYYLRRKVCTLAILPRWSRYVYFPEGFTRCRIRRAYDPLRRIRRGLRRHSFARKFLRPKII